jgi:hypothetical protein
LKHLILNKKSLPDSERLKTNNMKKLVRKAIELLKSKNTILCESIIKEARKDEINFK